MRIKYVIICYLLGFIFPHHSVLAQQQVSKPIFSAYDTKVTTNHFIYDLHLDTDGLLWIATEAGLIKWDGLHKTVFNNNVDQKEYKLQGERITIILEDENKNIIIGNGDSPPGFEQIDLKTEIPKGIDLSRIKTIEETLVNFWSVPNLGTFLCIIGKTKVHFYRFFPSGEFQLLGSQSIAFNHQDLRKKYTTNGKDHWLAVTGIGVWHWNNNDWNLAIDSDTIPLPQPLEAKIFHCDQKGNLWLNWRNQKGLWQATPEQPIVKEVANPFTLPLSNVEEDQNKNLLFIAGQYPRPFEQIWSRQDEQWVDYNWIKDTYPNVSNIYAKDFKDQIFVCTPSNIYLIQQKQPLIKQYLRQNLKEDQYGCIIKGINEDDEGNIYFLAETNYLFRINAKNRNDSSVLHLDTITLKEANSNSILKFNCGGEIIKDQQGFFWFKICNPQNYTGILVQYDPRTEIFQLFRHPQNFRSLALEPNKGIWVGHHDKKNTGRLSFFDFKKKRFTPSAEMGMDYKFPIPKYLFRGKDSLLWVGTIDGLGKIDLSEKSLDLYTTENTTLPDNHIITIQQNKEEELALGTHGGGLAFFNIASLKTKTFNTKDGLPNDYICGILPTEEGNYWISTFNGIAHFNTSLFFFTNFTTSSGFNYHEFNRHAFHRSKTGEYFFGNINGANSFYSNDLLQNKEQNQTGIANLQIYYGQSDSLYQKTKGLKTIETIELPHDFTYVELDLYHTGYLQKEGQKILTRLLGYDSDWEVTDPTRPLRFRNLRSGKYPLYLTTNLGGSIPIPEKPSIIISVRPPFYLTWWFILSTAMILLGGLWLWNRQRIKSIKKEEAEKSKNNLKFAELELQALQAQLNPHFIFNSLGAIQYFIKTNEKEKADGYLTDFARLMRLFLESSKNKYITLSEEIEMLSIYIKLEQLRFKDSFTSTITVDPELDPAQIYMPSLLLQPFIENSINHGLFHKKERGHLALDFSPMENEGLLVTLEDNGIGRTAAQEIKNNSVLNYKSRAMQIIDERREVLSKVEDYHIDIDIKDLYFSDGSAAGTKVTIKIPEIE